MLTEPLTTKSRCHAASLAMSFTINESPYFQPIRPSTRQPITVDAEPLTTTARTPTQDPSYQPNNPTPYTRVIEAKPVKEDTQLLAAGHIYTAHPALPTFIHIAQSHHHSKGLGSTIDTFV